MGKPAKTQPRKPIAQAVDAAMAPTLPGVAQVPVQQQTTQVFQGPVPPPEILERYEALVPGTAARLFKLAEEESLHRRALEAEANAANIAAQKRQLDIAEHQGRAVFRSDAIGQIAGLLVSLACIVGAVYLAMNGRDWVAAALAAIPTAAVIQAFFAKRQTSGQTGKPPAP